MKPEAIAFVVFAGVSASGGAAMIFAGHVLNGLCVIGASLVPFTVAMMNGWK